MKILTKFRWRVMAPIAIVAIGFSVAGCRTERAVPAGNRGEASSSSAKTDRKILYWKSPMNPGYISKGPGKDPMGMELVPVYEGEAPASSGGNVRIDPTTVQEIGVKTAVAHERPLHHTIRTVGRIDYDESTVRSISPKIGGWVEGQYVNFTGQVVRKGESLVEIYSPELVSTQDEYLLALRYARELRKSSLDHAAVESETLLRSAEKRLRYWDITEAQITALRERGKITRTMVLHAPFRGIVVKKDVLEGGFVKPGQALYEIADISTVWVYADVYEYEAPWLKLGQKATMTLAYEPGKSYEGRLVYIYPYLKEKTRTIQVRMAFRNDSNFDLKPGMWADVMVTSTLARKGVAVPVQAVLRTGRKDIALVALGDGHFEPRELKLGPQAGDEFEVLSGIKAGERVVTSAQFLINSESNLQAALSRMTEAAAAKPAPAGDSAGVKLKAGQGAMKMKMAPHAQSGTPGQE